MGLKAVVEKIEDLAEPLREFYAPGDDGKFHLVAEGVEDVSGLKNALAKERDALKSVKESLKQYDGVDPQKYHEWMAAQENDEEAKLFSSGKRDELKSRWTAKMQEAHAKELETKENQYKEQFQKLEQRAKTYEARVLDDQLRAATVEVEGFHKPATRDWLAFGRTVFVLDDTGKAVQKREDGTIVYGKDPRIPFSPKECLESQREQSPHWFSAGVSGTGAQPGRVTTNGSGQKTMTRAEFAKLTPQQQKDFALKEKGLVVDA